MPNCAACGLLYQLVYFFGSIPSLAHIDNGVNSNCPFFLFLLGRQCRPVFSLSTERRQITHCSVLSCCGMTVGSCNFLDGSVRVAFQFAFIQSYATLLLLLLLLIRAVMFILKHPVSAVVSAPVPITARRAQMVVTAQRTGSDFVPTSACSCNSRLCRRTRVSRCQFLYDPKLWKIVVNTLEGGLGQTVSLSGLCYEFRWKCVRNMVVHARSLF
jgi:hypothetical protein